MKFISSTAIIKGSSGYRFASVQARLINTGFFSSKLWVLVGIILAALQVVAFVYQPVYAETISSATYASPTTRYGHFALGRPHEYAQLNVTTSIGRQLILQLPTDEVFEDMAPRKIKFLDNEPEQLLTVISRHGVGARLAVIQLQGAQLLVSAQSPAIGTHNRWLNPVGVMDLDGDGHAEVAAVITPHIGGTLKVYRRDGAILKEIAALSGFSNHALGSVQLDLSTAMMVEGMPTLVVPDNTLTVLRQVRLLGGKLVEKHRCNLSARLLGALTVISPNAVRLNLSSGPVPLNLLTCHSD